MTKGWRPLLILVAAFAAALAGAFAGRALLPAPAPAGAELHALLHHGLNLDREQAARLHELERSFALRRTALELELRAENARLAEAIQAEGGYGPKVASTVDHSHAVMGQLQKETLQHIFAMRQLLRPDQAAKFDRAVVKALTETAR